MGGLMWMVCCGWPDMGGLSGAASVACPVRRRWPVRCGVGGLPGVGTT